jgi:hypothetical protein
MAHFGPQIIRLTGEAGDYVENHLAMNGATGYNYAYLGSTWTREKSSRYADGEAQRSLWGQAPPLGLVRRVGAFWYPMSEQECARTAEDL